MKLILIASIALAAAAHAQTPTPTATATPPVCSEVKSVDDPRDVVLLCDEHAGTIARAIAANPNLKTKLEAAAKKIATEKEKALMKVKDVDPARAKEKMDQLVGQGVPITKATQDAVNGAMKPSPTPSPSPTPTPRDGLD